MRRVNPVVYLDIILTTIYIPATKFAYDAMIVNFIIWLIITHCSIETGKKSQKVKVLDLEIQIQMLIIG